MDIDHVSAEIIKQLMEQRGAEIKSQGPGHVTISLPVKQGESNETPEPKDS